MTYQPRPTQAWLYFALAIVLQDGNAGSLSTAA
jgi:hypothetical protein